jgi:hypothetical protein
MQAYFGQKKQKRAASGPKAHVERSELLDIGELLRKSWGNLAKEHTVVSMPLDK